MNERTKKTCTSLLMGIVLALALIITAVATNVSVNVTASAPLAPATVEKIMSRPEKEANVPFINFGVQFSAPSMGKFDGINNYNDVLYGKAYSDNILINGKAIGNWPPDQVAVHANINWEANMKDAATGLVSDPADASKFWIHIGFSQNQLNFGKEGYNVITIKKEFPTNQLAATGVVRPTEVQTLDRDYHYLIKLMSDGAGFIFEEIDDMLAYGAGTAVLFPKTPTGEGNDYQMGNIVDTSYDKAVGYSFRAKDSGELMLKVGLDHMIDASKWANVSLSNVNLEMWVYTAKTKEEIGGGGHAIELSSGDAPDSPTEYEFNASDIYHNATFKSGMWNRVVYKLSEPRTPATELDLTSIRYFRHYYLGVTAPEKGIYFSNIRITNSPAQACGPMEQRKVLQYLAMPNYGTQSVGSTFTLDSTVSTYLDGAPGIDKNQIVYTSSDPGTISISGSTATVVKKGVATITATIPGNEQYEGATVTAEVVAKTAQTPMTISSGATHTYGTTYALATTGGSGAGEVTYNIVADGTTGAGTITGNVLTITKAGTFKLTATKAGDTDFNASTSEVFTLNVAKRDITVKISDKVIKQNTAIPTAFDVTLTAGSFATGEDIASVGVFNCTTTADGTVLGDFDITATVTSDNYNVTITNGKLTVKTATQTAITISSGATHTYGTTYALATTGGSGAGEVTFNIVVDGTTGAGTITGNVLTITKAGTFKLTATKAGDADFNASTSEVFTLNVAKLAITVKVKDMKITVNETLPQYAVELVTGTLASGDTLDSIAVFNYSGANNSTVGDLAISATCTSDNYDITIQNGTLKVEAKAKSGGCNSEISSSIFVLLAMLMVMSSFVAIRRKQGKK